MCWKCIIGMATIGATDGKTWFYYMVTVMMRPIVRQRVLLTTALADEEPCAGKLASTVLAWRWGRRLPHRP
jgi:hypothetical protein